MVKYVEFQEAKSFCPFNICHERDWQTALIHIRSSANHTEIIRLRLTPHNRPGGQLVFGSSVVLMQKNYAACRVIFSIKSMDILTET